MDWHENLKEIDACIDAQEWAKGYKTLSAAWAACERGDWMLWLIGKLDTSEPRSDERKPLVMCCCEIARTALQYTKDARVLNCIETTESWCRGEETQEQVIYAADAAYAAAYADRQKALKQSAKIVRKHYPIPPKI